MLVALAATGAAKAVFKKISRELVYCATGGDAGRAAGSDRAALRADVIACLLCYVSMAWVLLDAVPALCGSR